MKIYLILISSVMMLLSCSKAEAEPAPVPGSPQQLLTDKTWILSGFGLDYNSNGIIDMNEEVSEECQRDNLYQFNTDGSGLYSENQKSCNTGITEQPFSWKLLKEGKELDFFNDVLQILRLSESEMVLYSEIPLADGSSMRILISYHH